MRHIRFLCALSSALVLALIAPQPASATRTTVDGGAIFSLSGYCSPNAVGTPDCAPTSLPTGINIGGTTYDSFWVNSNGTVSFGSIESHLATQNSDPPTSATFTSLADFGSTPVFSPNFADGPGYFNFSGGGDYDGSFVADTTLTGSGFTVDFYTCGSPLFCGPRTADLLTGATFNQADYDNFQGLSFTVSQLSQLGPGASRDQAAQARYRAALARSVPSDGRKAARPSRRRVELALQRRVLRAARFRQPRADGRTIGRRGRPARLCARSSGAALTPDAYGLR